MERVFHQYQKSLLNHLQHSFCTLLLKHFFDVGLLNSELKAVAAKYPNLEDICQIEDSLVIARNKFPGQRNSLDALANRFEVSGYDRSFQGALLDANILADVYIYLTGGHSKLEFSNINNYAIEAKKIESQTYIDILTTVTLDFTVTIPEEAGNV